MNPKVREAIEAILAGHPLEVRVKLRALLDKTPDDDEPKGTRTGAQNRALWLDCELIADKLQAAGIDWKQVIREGGVDIPVTKESVMEFLWRPVMRVMFSIESTRDLKKGNGQIEKIHEVVMRTLGEKHHIEWHDFPSHEKQQLENLSGVRLAQHNSDGYLPGTEEYTGPAKF